MLERKVMLREYDGHIEFEESLRTYTKSSSGKLWPEENCIEVNGFLVPAPAEEFTEGLVHIADPGHVGLTYSCPIGCTIARETKLMFARGLAHRSAANAIAHAKAMLGIDPYAGESLDDTRDERPTPPAGEGLPRAGGDAVPPTPPGASSL